MNSTGNDHKLLVVTLKLLESSLAKVSGVCFLAMDNKYSIADFTGIRQNRHIHEGKCRSLIPAGIGIYRTRMITALGFVIVIIIFDKEGSVLGQYLGYATCFSIGTVLIIQSSL